MVMKSTNDSRKKISRVVQNSYQLPQEWTVLSARDATDARCKTTPNSKTLSLTDHVGTF